MIDLKDFLTVIDGMKFTSGQKEIPADMAYPIGMIYRMPTPGCGNGVSERIVEMIDESEYITRRNTTLKAISNLYPVFRIRDSYIYIHPKEIGYSDFTYLKYPSQAVVVVTTNEEGEEVYDEGASTELEWNDLAKLDIIASMLSSIGLNLRANEIIQVAESIKTKGV
jgi:hypothetical protein